MKEKLQRLFIFYLLLLPFVIWQTGYEGPKVIYFLTGSFFIVIFWIVRVLKYKISFDFSKADYFYLLWILILSISSFFGIHPLDSLLGGSYRHQGILFFLALWITGKTIQLLSKENRRFLLKGVGAMILIEAAIVILQYINGNTYFGTPLGTFGEPNAVAGFLGAGAFFLISQNLFFVAVILAAILLTLSKIGLFSFVISVSPLITKFGKKATLVLTLLIVIIAGAIGYQILGNKIKYLFAPKTSLWQLMEEDRVIIWRMSADKIVQKPILGWGAESGEVVLDAAYKEAGMPLKGMIVERSHNLFLDILIWSGVLGLIPFSAWLYYSFISIKDWGRRMSLISLLTYAMFEPLSIVHWILLILIVNI